MAVLRFKQHIGYYASLEPAGFSTYSLFTDTIATRTRNRDRRRATHR